MECRRERWTGSGSMRPHWKRCDPGLVVVRISQFGQHGPLRDRDATPLTMQAASGWINARDPDRPPVQAGARIAEYVAGGYAALGALTALRTLSANTVRSSRSTSRCWSRCCRRFRTRC